ncbi:hypothetical protein ALI144C_10875 [Actinosynnema sp. ALI-1.44]|nr:hypothetical protein ALI144C_10875 [Actinosynnema sp. ALI-1.44]
MMPPPGQGAPLPPPSGQPGAQFPPPGQPGAPLPPPEPKKKGFPKWAISLIVLIVIGGGIYAFSYFSNDAAQAKAGECAKVSGTKSKPDYKTVGCDSAEVTHVVGKALGKTSDSCGATEKYDEFTLTGRGPDTKLCLMPKWGEGDCRKADEATVDYPKVDCASAKGDSNVVKIVKVISGPSAEESQCPKETGPVLFPEPKTVYCVGPAE